MGDLEDLARVGAARTTRSHRRVPSQKTSSSGKMVGIGIIIGLIPLVVIGLIYYPSFIGPPSTNTSTTLPSPVQTPLAGTIPTLESLNLFAKKVAENLKKQMEEVRSGDVKLGYKVKITTTVVSTDIKRNDSLVHPIVGVVTIRMGDFLEGSNNLADLTVDLYTITLSPKGDDWDLVSATMKGESRMGTLSKEIERERDVYDWVKRACK